MIYIYMRKDKKQALLLRKQGRSYNEISKILSVPKGTLSYWFQGKEFEDIKKTVYTRSQKIWSKNITAFNKARSKKVWQLRFDERKRHQQAIGKITYREMLLVGTALYWGEGYKRTKWCISFCNSDPKMIEMIMIFFRKVCLVPNEKVRLRLQIAPNQDIKKAQLFWAKLTAIPMTQFHKTQTTVSSSSKGIKPKNTLPLGTLHVIIMDKNLVDKIQGWIAGLASAL